MVPGVEGFQTQFQAAASRFADHEALEQRDVPVVATGATQTVVWEGSPDTDGRSREGCRVKPLVDSMRSRKCTSEVWPVVATYPIALCSASHSDIDGQAGFHRDDARHFPAAESGFEETALGVAEQGDVVDEVNDSDLRAVIPAQSVVVGPTSPRVRDRAEVPPPLPPVVGSTAFEKV